MPNPYYQEKACSDCPFNESGPGRFLRDSLNDGRMESIEADLLKGKGFTCHQTTRQTGDGTNKLCAGAIAFQRRNNCVPQELQVGERLLAMREGRKARW